MSTLISNLNYIESCKLDIKSAIEAKGVDMTGVSFPDYATAIENIPAGGGYTEKDITERNINIVNLNNSASFVAATVFYSSSLQTVNLPECLSVSMSAFAYCSSLSQVSLPVCKYIGTAAFYQCKSLTSIDLPECLSVSMSAFTTCSSLSQVSLPVCKYIGGSAFAYCKSLTSIDLPECSVLFRSAFDHCTSLTSVNLPKCSDINSFAFYSCALSSIDLPECLWIGNSAFAYCYSLSVINIPKCSYIGSSAFSLCFSLTSIELPNCYRIEYAAFRQTGLSNVTLPGSSVCSISTSVFDVTPIASGTGYIYVPASLVDTYKTAQNWSVYSDQIFPIDVPPTPTSDLSFSDGLLYGGVASIESTFIEDYSLGITADQVTAVSLSACSYIGPETFESYFNISTLSLPEVLVVSDSAFLDCKSLTSVDLPKATEIGAAGFRWCSSLNYVSLGSCTTLNSSAFAGCDLLSISAPLVTYAGVNAFTLNKNLKSLYLPALESVSNGTFTQCTNLQYVSLPNLRNVSLNMFNGTTMLYGINLPKCQEISAQGFFGCQNLEVIFLGNNVDVQSVIPLGSINVFNSTKVRDIYVPSSLYNDYQTADVWSTPSIRTLLKSMPSTVVAFNNQTSTLIGSATSIGSGYYASIGITANDVVSVDLPLVFSIESNTFEDHTNLTSYSLPNISVYPDYLFAGTAISSLVFDKSVTFGDCVFGYNDYLENVEITYIGDVLSVGSSMFYSCPNLSQITVPYDLYSDYLTAQGWSEYSNIIVQGVEPDLFFSDGLVYGSRMEILSTYLSDLGIIANDVTAVSLSECLTVGSSAFRTHYNLSTVNLPQCTYIYNQAFAQDAQLTTISLPVCKTLSTGCFNGCGLTDVYLPEIQTLGQNAFINCRALSRVVLGGSTVVTLSNSNAFNSTTAEIWVPESLYNNYLTANNWSKMWNAGRTLSSYTPPFNPNNI